MDPLLLAGLVVLLLLVLIALETPVAWSLALSGAVGIMVIRNPSDAFNLLRESPLHDVSVYALAVIPMYMLLGNLALNGRLAGQVFQVAAKVAGRSKSTIGVATILACGSFAAVSGSSVATAAIMSRIALPQMVRYGYPPHLAAGIVAAGGTLGILIPPSIVLVVLGLVTEQSITQLLAAGIIPGILTVIAYSIFVMVRVAPQVRPQLTEGPVSEDTGAPVRGVRTAAALGADGATAPPADASRLTMQTYPSTLTSNAPANPRVPYRGAVRAGVIFLLVFAGIYLGWMTVSESAALAALAALLFLIIELRKDGTKAIGRAVGASLRETGAATAMVFSILIGSAIFSYFVVLTGLPRLFTEWVGTLNVPPLVIVVVLLALLLPMGMALDALAIIVLAMPFMYPIIESLGYSGIWFGILAVKLIEMGLMTPPVGINVFVVAGTAREHVSSEQVFRGVLGFVLVDIVVVAILLAFPSLVLFLPNLAA